MEVECGCFKKYHYGLLRQYEQTYSDTRQRWTHQMLIQDRRLPNYQQRQIAYWNWLDNHAHLYDQESVRRNFRVPSQQIYDGEPVQYYPPQDVFERNSRRSRNYPEPPSQYSQQSFHSRPESPTRNQEIFQPEHRVKRRERGRIKKNRKKA